MCKSFQWIIGLVICLSVSAPAINVTYSGGSGTADNPYQLGTASDWQALMSMTSHWGKHFILTEDFSLLAIKVSPVGSETQPFTGSLDGKGHRITSVSIKTSSTGVGLFGFTGTLAVIENLVVDSINISSGGIAGGLTGTNRGAVRFCRVNGSVSGDYDCGGLAGRNLGSISNCYVDMMVTVKNYTAGGLVGFNPGSVSNCGAMGAVSGIDYVGGLVGYHNGTLLESCYATGKVTGKTNTGGLVGYLYTSATACFWDTQTSGMTDGVGNRNPDPAGAMGKTTAQMQTLSTFTGAGWDFSFTDGDAGNWWMPYNDYPRVCLKPYGGDGIEETPYQIWTAEQMNAIGLHSEDWASCFALMADIDMSAYTGTQYNIIGGIYKYFTGTFEGNGHVISNLTYTTTDTIQCAGVFGYISGSKVRGLGLVNLSFLTDGTYVGGLVGINDSGTLDSCYVTGTVSGIQAVGGLAGANVGTITNCYVAGDVTGSQSVGGLAGVNFDTITSCYAIAAVSGSDFIGGLAGGNSGTITNCYASGSATGSQAVGGLAGDNYNSITNCYAVAAVSGSDSIGGLTGLNSGGIAASYAAGAVTGSGMYVGGFCGYQENDGAVIENSFWDTQVSKQTVGCNQDANHPGTVTNLAGKTTALMKTLSTFTSAGWDFTDTDGDAAEWQMFVNDYPRMPWETGSMALQKCTTAAGKTSDSISFSGIVDASTVHFDTALANADNLLVHIDAPRLNDVQEFVFPVTAATYKKGKFAAKDARSSIKMDTKTGKMTFAAKNLDLTGLYCPVTVWVNLGDYTASFIMDEPVINGSKPCPLQFLRGVETTLTVTQFKNKNGTKPNTDSFTAQGTFTLGSLSNKDEPVYIYLGSQTFRVEGKLFNDKNNVISCKKALSDDDGIVDAKFDFNKCTFTVSVKNAEITQTDKVGFAIDCFGIPNNGLNDVMLK